MTQDQRWHRRHADDGAGTLVLIGGAASPQGTALGTFLDLCRARDGGRVVGLTTASADPAGSAALWRKDFADAGATRVEMPVVDRREIADDPAIADLLRDADGIFLGGGDQVHLIATIAGTRSEAAIREAFARGATVCGTSAGSAALTETTLAGGEVDEEGNLVEMYIGPGFGLLGFGAMIDTHFAQRRRLHRLFVAIAQYPDLMGLGIDEDTALVVHGHTARVEGAGGVTFVDGRSVRFDNAHEVVKGRQLTLSHLRVGIVGTGYEFDLRERELVTLLTGGGGTGEVEGERLAGRD